MKKKLNIGMLFNNKKKMSKPERVLIDVLSMIWNSIAVIFNFFILYALLVLHSLVMLDYKTIMLFCIIFQAINVMIWSVNYVRLARNRTCRSCGRVHKKWE